MMCRSTVLDGTITIKQDVEPFQLTVAMTSVHLELFARAQSEFPVASIRRSAHFAARARAVFRRPRRGRQDLGRRWQRIHRLRRHLGPGDSWPCAASRDRAVREAAARGVSFGIPNPLEVEMAELICQWVPSIEKVRMVNSGTEATMSCIRLARGFTGRDKIIKFEGCYHGHVDSLLVQRRQRRADPWQSGQRRRAARFRGPDDRASVQ